MATLPPQTAADFAGFKAIASWLKFKGFCAQSSELGVGFSDFGVWVGFGG